MLVPAPASTNSSAWILSNRIHSQPSFFLAERIDTRDGGLDIITSQWVLPIMTDLRVRKKRLHGLPVCFDKNSHIDLNRGEIWMTSATRKKVFYFNNGHSPWNVVMWLSKLPRLEKICTQNGQWEWAHWWSGFVFLHVTARHRIHLSENVREKLLMTNLLWE